MENLQAPIQEQPEIDENNFVPVDFAGMLNTLAALGIQIVHGGVM